MKKKADPRTKAPKKKADDAAKPFFRPFSKLPKKVAAEEAPAQKPAPKPPKAPKPPPSEAADAATFAMYMAGVRALDQGTNRIPLTASRIDKSAPSAPADDADAPARAALRSLVVEGLRFEVIDDGERIEGRRLDVDPRDLRRVRRGQFAVDGKLHLHGLAAGEARAAVEAFVKKRAQCGDVCVLVVHGKGSHSPRGVGVLRGEIAAWLSQGRSARHVRAFASAPEGDASADGVSGALLVLAR